MGSRYASRTLIFRASITQVRRIRGVPLKINSGCRDQTINGAVKAGTLPVQSDQ
jgi:hypothetical protein